MNKGLLYLLIHYLFQMLVLKVKKVLIVIFTDTVDANIVNESNHLEKSYSLFCRIFLSNHARTTNLNQLNNNSIKMSFIFSGLYSKSPTLRLVRRLRRHVRRGLARMSAHHSRKFRKR